MHEFKEELLFFKYKDSPLDLAKIKKDCQRLHLNYSELYAKLTKYQVKKYGKSLSNSRYFEVTSAKDLIKEKHRRNSKKKRQGRK